LNGNRNNIEEAIITASGGPFLKLPISKFKKIKLNDASFLSKYKPYLVMATTTDKALNRKIVEKARKMKSYAYASDDPEIRDFSHPPKIIPQLIEEIKTSKNDIAIASRYTEGGKVNGWSTRRKLISKTAKGIAKAGLGVNESDPMSGFFAFRRKILEGIKFDAIGYKMLLEILVKTKGAKVKEIPYTFTDRTHGSSKLDSSTMLDYIKSVWKLYRYGRKAKVSDTRTSIRFISKAGRFYTVGASGLLVNNIISLLFADAIIDFWYIHATIIGIAVSMSSNFILNKIWTFEDRNFEAKKTLAQYG